jgi:ATP-binding cassette subfamily B protein
MTVDGSPFQGWEGLAFIPAQPYFFRGTVLENITLGRDIPEEEVRRICRSIGAEDFILRLPQGYHTPLGQQGINLSGGQGQLLSIARAMVSPARILLCDEATGSLDAETEAVVQRAMEHLFAQKTVVISAHRLHTLRRVQQVLVLREGTLVQQGSFEGLAAQREGLFAQLLEKGLVE